MAVVLKPPAPLPLPGGKPAVFLAGSIEMGTAEDWQTSLAQSLADLDIVILNPRREEWDASWEQRWRDARFREQVEWELAAQELATHIVFYFAPITKAPVTLLELGLAARSGKALVCCPDGYWRKGNIEVVCARYHVPLVETLADLAAALRKRLMS
ncbi:MAG: nucleoside 2-deoxyribosyltransferase domain-containing protein [Verrucomicrobiota bacterium]